MKVFLSSTTLLATCSLVAAEPPLWAKLPQRVRDKFLEDKFLKKDFNIPLQAIGNNGNGIQSRCKASPIFLDNLEPVSSAGHTCLDDGNVVPCPPFQVFTKMDGNTKITVSRKQNGDINNIQVVDPACGSEVFEAVSPDLVASIPPEAYDEAELSKFIYADHTMDTVIRRNLRGAGTPTDAATQQAERDL